MKSKDGMFKFLAGAAALIIVGFFCLKIYELSSSSFETQTVYEQKVLDTVDAEMFIIRDEMLLSSESSGVIVPIASNGERVSRGSEIAAIFPSEASANNYTKLGALNAKLESYMKINSQLRLANLDINKLTGEINSDYFSLMDSVYYNDYSSLEEDEISFAEKLSRKQISLDEEVDCTGKIAELQNEISTVKAAAVPQRIISAETSGYYVSKPDGYEDILTVDDIETLTQAQLDVALNAEKKEIPSDSLGKIISGYNWYIACTVETAKLSDYKVGNKINLLIGDNAENTVQTELYKMLSVDNMRSVAVFKCNLMNEELATLRIVNGKIVLAELSGLKVRKDAVRIDDDGKSAVFIRRGNIVNIRSINIIYSDENYVYAEKPDEESGIKLPYTHIKLYDRVVISGKDIYDGMVIG